MKDRITFPLLLVLCLGLALGGMVMDLPLTVSAQGPEPDPSPELILYLPLIFKGDSPPLATPTPPFACAPHPLGDIPVGYEPRGLAVDEGRNRGGIL